MAEAGIVPLTLLSPGQARNETGKDQALTRCQAHIQDLETQIAALMSQKAEYQAVKRLVQETPADLLELLQTILCEQRSHGQRTG